MSVITQELCSGLINVLSEFDKRVLKAKIDFLINASKFEILFITNISLAQLRRQLAIYIIVCITNLRKCSLFVNSPKIKTIKCLTETSTQFNKLIFATIVLYRLEEYFWTTNNQFGYKAGHSTDLCVYALTEFIEYFKGRSTSVYVAFLDASKAFAKINHWILFKKLLCPVIYLGNSICEFVKEVKYLGVMIHSSMKTTNDVSRQTRKFYLQTNLLLRNF